MSNQKEAKQENCLKRGKTQATRSWLVLVLHLIGWESGASFLNQSQSEYGKIYLIPDYFNTQSKISLTQQMTKLELKHSTDPQLL